MHRSMPLLTFAGLLCMAGLADVAAQTPQTLYSYVDESGVRILTNIPPKGPVRDLSITGQPPAAQKAPSRQAATGAVTAYDPIIDRYAGEYRLDPSLIKAMISAESGFNARAVSPKGARGLMQLMPATAARHGVQNIHDPEENIRGGVKHMRSLMDTFNNDLVLSLAAYNAGENLVQRIGKVPNYRETREYVRTITNKYGGDSMELTPEKPVSRPAMFRFLDENGILHLTNQPPVRHDEGS